jgi:F-type H+-transporting ATPase subunit b
MVMKFSLLFLAAILLAACLFWPVAAAAAESAQGSSVNPLSVDPDLAIFTMVVFLVLLLVLSKLAWKPLIAGLDQRERSIADMIRDAERNQQESAERLREYERKLQAAAVEAQEIVTRARRDAEVVGQQLLAEAREDARRERLRALADIDTAKNAAVREIARQSADLAFTLARKLIRKELKPEDHALLVRESLRQFPSEN